MYTVYVAVIYVVIYYIYMSQFHLHEHMKENKLLYKVLKSTVNHKTPYPPSLNPN